MMMLTAINLAYYQELMGSLRTAIAGRRLADAVAQIKEGWAKRGRVTPLTSPSPTRGNRITRLALARLSQDLGDTPRDRQAVVERVPVVGVLDGDRRGEAQIHRLASMSGDDRATRSLHSAS